MKRILPILLVLSMMLLALFACGPEETPTTTVEITSSTNRTTTSKILQNGISDKDDGWSFWSEK